MELKSYQKKVIADLTRYLELLNETQNYMTAFEQFWREKSAPALGLSLIHISEPTRRTPISYAVFCLKKKKQR